MAPSSHMHQIVGGNAFAASMPTTDIAKLGSCTTCHFKEDISNYWTANLYFKARNGTYKRVPQMANQFNDGDNAGITIYYTSPGPNLTTAFKPVCPKQTLLESFPFAHSSVSRASACSLETRLSESQIIWERRCSNATAATQRRTGAAVGIRRAWIPTSTPTTFRRSHASAESGQTSFFPCMKSTTDSVEREGNTLTRGY